MGSTAPVTGSYSYLIWHEFKKFALLFTVCGCEACANRLESKDKWKISPYSRQARRAGCFYYKHTDICQSSWLYSQQTWFSSFFSFCPQLCKADGGCVVTTLGGHRKVKADSEFKLAVCESCRIWGDKWCPPKFSPQSQRSERKHDTQHKAFRELTRPPSARWRVLRQNEWHTCIHALQYTQVIQGPVSPFQHTACEFEHLIRNQRNGKIDTSLTVQLFHSLHVTRVMWSVYLSTLRLTHIVCVRPVFVGLTSPLTLNCPAAHRGLRVPAQHVCCWCVRSYVHCFFMLRHTDVWVHFRGMWLHWKRRLRVFFPLKYLRTFSPSRLKLKTEPRKVILKWCALVSRCWVVV